MYATENVSDSLIALCRIFISQIQATMLLGCNSTECVMLIHNLAEALKMFSISPFLSLILPLSLAYLIIVVRLFERIRIPESERGTFLTVLSVRDSALATLALDLAELLRRFEGMFLGDTSSFSTALVFILFFLHFTIFVAVSSREREGQESFRTVGHLLPKFLSLYLALTLLMTNAVTMFQVLGVLERLR